METEKEKHDRILRECEEDLNYTGYSREQFDAKRKDKVRDNGQ